MKHCIFYKMVERYPPHSPNKTGDCIEEREDSWPPSWMIPYTWLPHFFSKLHNINLTFKPIGQWIRYKSRY